MEDSVKLFCVLWDAIFLILLEIGYLLGRKYCVRRKHMAYI